MTDAAPPPAPPVFRTLNGGRQTAEQKYPDGSRRATTWNPNDNTLFIHHGHQGKTADARYQFKDAAQGMTAAQAFLAPHGTAPRGQLLQSFSCAGGAGAPTVSIGYNAHHKNYTLMGLPGEKPATVSGDEVGKLITRAKAYCALSATPVIAP